MMAAIGPRPMADEHPDLPAVMRAVFDEIVGPDVVGLLRPRPDARTIVEPETAPLWLSSRYLQPLASPNALDPLLVHDPARVAQVP